MASELYVYTGQITHGAEVYLWLLRSYVDEKLYSSGRTLINNNLATRAPHAGTLFTNLVGMLGLSELSPQRPRKYSYFGRTGNRTRDW